MTVVPVAARAVAGRAATRAGAGKVVDAKVVSSKPLKASAARSRTSDVATGAGLGQLADNLPGRGRRGGRGGGAPSSARRVLVAEFAVCMTVLAFSPLTDRNRSEAPAAFMKRATATMGMFFILGLIATGGRGASRAAAGFGGLVTLVLLISSRSIFTVLATKLGRGVGEDEPDDGFPDTEDDDAEDGDIGGVVGGAVGELPRLFPSGALRSGVIVR